MWPKSESILNTHPIIVHTKFESDCVNTFSDICRTPPFSVIFWPPEGQHWPTWAKSESNLNTHPISVHTKYELDCVNTFSDNDRKPSWRPTLKSEQFLNTHLARVHHKFELDGVNTFSDNGQKPPPIFSRFLATRGLKLDQRSPKAHQFWPLTEQMHRPNLKLIEWLLFQGFKGFYSRKYNQLHTHQEYVVCYN